MLTRLQIEIFHTTQHRQPRERQAMPGCYSLVSISDRPTYGDVQCIDGVTFFPEPVGLSLDLAWCLCGVIQNPETTSECINQCQERYSSKYKGLVN